MQLVSTFSFLEILTFFSVIEMYIKMSEISNFWLSVLISQVAPYLMFILVSKSIHPVSSVLSSQNAQCFYISAPLCCIVREIKKTSTIISHDLSLPEAEVLRKPFELCFIVHEIAHVFICFSLHYLHWQR